MTRLYVAGPITGVPDFFENFQLAGKELSRAGYTVSLPTLIDEFCWDFECWNFAKKRTKYTNDIAPHTWECYMRHCLQLMLKCDGVALMDGFFNSPGATFELLVAQTCDLQIGSVGDWIERAQA